ARSAITLDACQLGVTVTVALGKTCRKQPVDPAQIIFTQPDLIRRQPVSQMGGTASAWDWQDMRALYMDPGEGGSRRGPAPLAAKRAEGVDLGAVAREGRFGKAWISRAKAIGRLRQGRVAQHAARQRREGHESRAQLGAGFDQP